MPEIEIRDLSFTYENRTTPALQDINLSVESRELILLAGASGSGKSTLLKCVNGLIPHRYVGSYSGEVKVGGTTVARTLFLSLSLLIGTVLQEVDKQLVSSSVEDEVAFGPSNLALPLPEVRSRVEDSLSTTGIQDLRERSIFALSGGQKQRLAIADILAMEPSIFLFDEPLANLDSNGVKLMQEVFREFHRQGKTLVVSEHRTEEVLNANPTRVIVIADGRIVADSPDPQVLSDFASVLKVPAEYALAHAKRTRAQVPPFAPAHLAPKETGAQLLACDNLVYEYPRGVRALDGVTFAIREGERVAVLGNNGAGKSTLALALMGLLKPSRGRVLVGGRATTESSVSEIARYVGIVFQSPFSMLFSKTVRDEMTYGPKNLGFPPEEISRIIPEVAEQCGIAHLLDRSPFASSFGEKKRISVGAVLAMQPKCIILDEPTAGQDYRSYTNFMNFIGSFRGSLASFILITHDPDLAIEYADRSIVMHGGRVIADGPTRTLLADSELMKRAAIRETSQIRLSRKYTAGSAVLPLREIASLFS